jgi:hypothetical protein
MRFTLGTLIIFAVVVGTPHVVAAVPVPLTYTLDAGASQSVIPGGNPISSGSFSVTLFASGDISCVLGGPLASGSGACLHSFTIGTTAGIGATAHLTFPAFFTYPSQSVSGGGLVLLDGGGFSALPLGVSLSFSAFAGVLVSGNFSGAYWYINSGTATLPGDVMAFTGQEVPAPGPTPLFATGLMILAPFILLRWRRRYS